MQPSDIYHRLVLLAIGLLIIFTPLFILVVTIWFLTLTGELLLKELTLIELLELYIIDLILFGGATLFIYWLALRLIRRQLPLSLDALESQNLKETINEDSKEEIEKNVSEDTES